MSDEAILQELMNIKDMISQKQSILPRRWISFSEACKYASKSENWMRERLVTGKIFGHQETTKKGNEGNWTVDLNSIDDYFSGHTNMASDVRDIKRRAGI